MLLEHGIDGKRLADGVRLKLQGISASSSDIGQPFSNAGQCLGEPVEWIDVGIHPSRLSITHKFSADGQWSCRS
ncbi:hypothetical protein [Sinorhizobium meliloti]|uniref:hypothetical protein n=1 Tax=Rhizobium meliloti TaxID=382 RepID=UPI001071F381|nr:hypothetical protein [Sinorhizobium meliloti]